MDLSEIVENYNKDVHGSFDEYFDNINYGINKQVLDELHLDDTKLKKFLKKLKKYKYVEEVDDLKYGSFIKWIPLTDSNNLRLNYSGIICAIKFTNEGTVISCKNLMNRYYTIKIDECLIFQKFTNEEENIIDMLSNIYEN